LTWRLSRVSRPGQVLGISAHHGGPGIHPALRSIVAGILRLERTDVKVLDYKDATHGFASQTAADKQPALESKAETIKFFETRL